MSGRSPGEGNSNPLQYSCLENSIDREACQPTIHGVAKSQIQLIYIHICTLLIIREMQIKTTMSYYLTPIRMTIIKKSTNDKSWQECGEKGTLPHWYSFKWRERLYNNTHTMSLLVFFKFVKNLTKCLYGYNSTSNCSYILDEDVTSWEMKLFCLSSTAWQFTLKRVAWSNSIYSSTPIAYVDLDFWSCSVGWFYYTQIIIRGWGQPKGLFIHSSIPLWFLHVVSPEW